jgi:hypothetical protein
LNRLALQPQLDAFELKRSIDRLVPILAAKSGSLLVAHFVRRLATVIDMEQSENVRDSAVDFSGLWRPDIATGDHIHEYDARSILIDGILRATEVFLAAGGDLPEILATIRECDKWVCRRLELHLVRLNGDASMHAEYLLRRDLFPLASTRREYRALLNAACRDLTPTQLEEIFGWVDTGDEERFASSYSKAMGSLPSEAELRRHRSGWRLMWLSAVGDCLDEKRRLELAELEALFELPAEAERQSHPGSASVDAPLADDEVAALTGADLLAYAAEASANGSVQIDALARQLTSIASSNPQTFDGVPAERLVDLDPTFAQAIAAGIRQAIEQKRSAPWSFVLALSTHVAEATDIPPRKGDRFDYEPDWTSARIAVGSLISASLRVKDFVPADAASTVWQLITRLAKDPNPDPDYEARYGPPNMGPSTLALNTVRPVAIAAALDFASWTNDISGRSELDPRVADLLGVHLSSDSSVAVRAVFGERFVKLHLLDSGWARDNLSLIFGATLMESDLGRVAWQAFLFHHQPHADLLKLLEPYYREAALASAGEVFDHTAVSRLADHLAVYYVWGLLNLEDKGLVAIFFDTAPQAARRHFLETIGEILRSNPEPPVEIAIRLRELWQLISASAEGPRKADLSEFGWWFGADRLEDEWSLQTLLTTLRMTALVKNEVRVAERLQRLAPAYPEAVLDALLLMAIEDRRGWVIYSLDPVIRGAVQAARASGRSGSEAADRVVSRLLAAGFVEFGDLATKA